MSIASRITAITGHITDIYDTLELGGDTTQNKNIININTEIKREYKNFLAHGVDVLWNNWEKVSGTGETLSLSPTIKGKMKVDLKGNTYQGLPSGYQAVEYIQSSGTQYIDTGYKIKQATDIVETTISVSRESGSKFPFGTYDTGSYYGINFSGTATAFRFYNGSATASVSIDYGASNEKIDFKITPTTIYANNTSIGTYTSQSGTTAYNIYLFCASQSNSVVFNSNTKMYRFKITSGNNVVRYFIPCYRTSDSVIGLYDLVEGKFYTNAGTGTFAKGNDITLPTPDTPIPVQVVSGDNSIKVEGRNRFVFNDFVGKNNNNITLSNIENNKITATLSVSATWSTFTYKISNLKKNTKYTLKYLFTNSTSDSSYNNATWIKIDREDGTTAFNSNYYLNDVIVFNTNDNTSANFIFHVTKGGTATTNTLYVYDTQLIEGEYTSSTIPTYTPYVSQTYPISLGNIELCKIGTYQDKIAKSTGKNLFDKNAITDSAWLLENGTLSTGHIGYSVSDFIPVAPNTNYYKLYSASARSKYYDKNKQPLNTTTYQDIPIGAGAGTFTTPSNCYYVRITFAPSSYTTLDTFMVNEGTTALPYEPYGKVWYLNKQIGKVVLDGSESWTLNSSSGDSYRYFLSSSNFSNVFDNIITGYEGTFDNKILTNYFTYSDWEQTQIGTFSISNVSQAKWFLLNTNITTIGTFETWLSNHNTSVYFPLATPTYEEITGELLSQLEALAYSYEGTTNISQVNDDMHFVLDITALKEMS